MRAAVTAIKGDKTQEFERLIQRLRHALQESNDPERRRQAEGWKVLRLDTPLPNGSIVYVHMIDPIVAGADCSVMRALYEAFPDERQALYDLYRDAFDHDVALATAAVSVHLSTKAAPSGNLH